MVRESNRKRPSWYKPSFCAYTYIDCADNTSISPAGATVMASFRDIGFLIIEYQYVASLCSAGILLVIPTPFCPLTLAPPFFIFLMKHFRILMAETYNFQIAIFLMSASPISIINVIILTTTSLTASFIKFMEHIPPILALTISTAQVFGLILLIIQFCQVDRLVNIANWQEFYRVTLPHIKNPDFSINQSSHGFTYLRNISHPRNGPVSIGH